MVARRGLQPIGLDARFFRRFIPVIAAADDALGRDGARRTGGKEIGPPRTVRPLHRQVDSIEAIVFGVHIAGLGVEVRVVHLYI